MKAFSLEGKTAVITGGGSGLGLGIAQIYVEAGAKVVLLGRDEHKLSMAQEQLGDRCFYRVFDVTRTDAVPELVVELEQLVGPVSVLVNCAGIHLKKNAIETSDVEFLSVLQVHLHSVFAFTREFSKRMLERQEGMVLFISSMSAVMGMKQVVAYSTAKTALIGMMRALVSEFAEQQVRVNTIAPGWIDTPMLHQAIDQDEPRKEKILNRIPSRRFGRPEDIGYAALYLAAEAGKYVNGVFLPVDAGAAGAF